MEICAKLFDPNLARREAASGIPQDPRPVGACSGCAGDYEDPDRTARVTEGGDEAEESDAPEPDAEAEAEEEQEEFPTGN